MVSFSFTIQEVKQPLKEVKEEDDAVVVEKVEKVEKVGKKSDKKVMKIKQKWININGKTLLFSGNPENHHKNEKK